LWLCFHFIRELPHPPMAEASVNEIHTSSGVRGTLQRLTADGGGYLIRRFGFLFFVFTITNPYFEGSP